MRANFALKSLIVAISMVIVSSFAPMPTNALGSYIYTTDYNGGLKKWALDGSGTQSSVGSVTNATDVVATGTDIFVSYHGIRKVSLDGLTVTSLRTVSDQLGMHINGNYLYYGYETTRKIGRMNLDGTGANDSYIDYSSTTAAPFSACILIVSGTLYFGCGSNQYVLHVWKIPVGGGTPTACFTDTAGGVNSLTSDGTYIYWTNYWVGKVGRVKLDCTGAEPNWITGQTYARGIVYANGYLYFNKYNYIARITPDLSSTNYTWKSNVSSQSIAIADAGPPTVVASTTSISIPVSIFTYRQVTTLSATSSSTGKITFKANGKKIGGCISLPVNSLNSYTTTCNYSPAIHGPVIISANYQSSDSSFYDSLANSRPFGVITRSNTR